MKKLLISVITLISLLFIGCSDDGNENIPWWLIAGGNGGNRVISLTTSTVYGGSKSMSAMSNASIMSPLVQSAISEHTDSVSEALISDVEQSDSIELGDELSLTGICPHSIIEEGGDIVVPVFNSDETRVNYIPTYSVGHLNSFRVILYDTNDRITKVFECGFGTEVLTTGIVTLWREHVYTYDTDGNVIRIDTNEWDESTDTVSLEEYKVWTYVDNVLTTYQHYADHWFDNPITDLVLISQTDYTFTDGRLTYRETHRQNGATWQSPVYQITTTYDDASYQYTHSVYNALNLETILLTFTYNEEMMNTVKLSETLDSSGDVIVETTTSYDYDMDEGNESVNNWLYDAWFIHYVNPLGAL